MIKIITAENYADLSRRAAEIISAQVAAKPTSVLGLATGSTPVGTYEELRKRGVDFSRVTTFNLDEYFPISKDNEKSFAFFMRKHLFDFVPVAETNIPNGEAASAEDECAEYEKKIAAKGGIDLQLLGIGKNGHIAFNEPADFFPAKTHAINLAESTRKANARFFANESEVPRRAITMGIGTIMAAKKILLIASGASKKEILHEALFGKITPKIPASALQLHHDVTVIADAFEPLSPF